MGRLITLLISCLLLEQTLAAESGETDEAALQRVRQEILKMIEPGLCRNLVHCRLLPLGLSPCGGPSEYLAYSSALGAPETLESKAAEYAFLEEEVRGKHSSDESCVPLGEYQALCVNNHCKAQAVKK